MQPTRLGVIGAGLIWIRTHKPILDTMKDAFEPIAFSDLSEDRRTALANEFPKAQITSDYQALLENPEVETVLVLTPIALNAPIAKAALQAGKHVIMEKPIARSVEEGSQLVATARKLGRRLFVAEQMGYRSAEDQLAQLIADREIGDLVMWSQFQHVEADTAQGPLRYESTPWRKQADFPLGTLFDGGIHAIAGLSKVYGIPETVAASGKQLRPEYGEYDHVAALFGYANGLTGMFSYSSYLPVGVHHYNLHGTEGMIVIEYSQMIVKKPQQPDRRIELPRENSYAEMWKAFARAIREQREPFYTAEHALGDVATLVAVDQAIKSGGRVAVAAPGQAAE